MPRDKLEATNMKPIPPSSSVVKGRSIWRFFPSNKTVPMIKGPPIVEQPSFDQTNVMKERAEMAQSELSSLRKEKAANDLLASGAARHLRVCLEDVSRIQSYKACMTMLQLATVIAVLVPVYLIWGMDSVYTEIVQFSIIGVLLLQPSLVRLEEHPRLEVTMALTSLDSILEHSPHVSRISPTSSRMIVKSPALADHFANIERLQKHVMSLTVCDVAGYKFNIAANLGLDVEEDLLDKLSPLHLTELAELRQIIKSDATFSEYEPLDDFTLYRFLLVESFVPVNAARRLREAMRWRRLLHVEELVTHVPWNLIRRGYALRPQTFCGFDLVNRPVYVEKLGVFLSNEQAWKGLSSREWEKVLAFHYAEVTCRCRVSIRQTRKPLSEVVYIVDMDHFNFRRGLSLLPYLWLATRIQRHFGLILEIIFVNMPRSLMSVWNIVTSLVDAAAPHKIIMYSNEARKELIENLGKGCIPREWGGASDVTLLECPRQVDVNFDKAFPL